MALGDATIAVPNSTGSSQLPQDIGSILALFGGIQGSSDLQKIAQSADPWGPQRAQYQTQLNQFMANPASIFTDPAFQAAENVGAENISRQAGAAGMASSGNRLADLFNFGQSSALNFEQQRFNELANLAGVNAGSPVAAAGLQTGALQTQGSNLATGLAGVIPMILSALGLSTNSGLGGAIGSAISKLFGGGDPFAGFNPDDYTGVATGTIGGSGETGGVDPNIDLGTLFNSGSSIFGDAGSLIDTGGNVFGDLGPLFSGG